jgi:adenylate kinase
MSSRRQCPKCGNVYSQLQQHDNLCPLDGTLLIRRKDDQEDVIRERLKAFNEMTLFVANYYKGGNYYVVDGSRQPDVVSQEIASIVETKLVTVKQSRLPKQY